MVVVPLRRVVRGVDALGRLRSEARAWLGALPLPRAVVEELIVALNELATNAVKASPRDEAEVELRAEAGELELTVSNDGPPFRWDAGSHTPAFGSLGFRHRGLDLVAAFGDDTTVTSSGGITTAVLRRRLGG